ncbi:hypothetical protein HK100_000668 [Physocladia obscura]|uniref:glutathione transferase n=1 Tax=Physocladia obscura TaxID=109957 RepID=A0AAD5SY92_9FUNG|nr:hypothetical protein HK100_000668 [Physocladia obscura]
MTEEVVTITLHHLEHSRSFRIAWLLEELNVKYDMKVYPRDPITRQAPVDLLAVHPLGKSPVIVDNSFDPHVVVAESGAIIEYLLERFPDRHTLIPARQTAEKRNYTYWLHATEGSFAPPIITNNIFDTIPQNVPFPVSSLVRFTFTKYAVSVTNPTIKRFLDYLESEVSKHKFLCGDSFTAADIHVYLFVVLANRQIPDNLGPNTQAWMAELSARNAFKRVEKLL